MPHKKIAKIITTTVILTSLVILVVLIQSFAREENERKINRILSQMTLEEKVGQLFVTSFSGQTSTEALYRLRRFHNGGFILYSENVLTRPQLKHLTAVIKGSASRLGIPSIIAIDHEGGRINRILSIAGRVRSSREMVIKGNPEKVFAQGKSDARLLRSLGINLNFAPVLDVRTNSRDTMLRDRSFGDDPKLVSEFGIRYLKGLSSGGMTGVVKHFPGHGSVDVDSHFALPVVERSLEKIEIIDLKPFADAIAEGAKAIMIGHLLVPVIDDEWPSSISSKVIRGLLREKMGFKGIVFTDALDMGALKGFGSPGTLAVLALKAGNDMLLADWSVSEQADAYGAVLRSVKSGDISQRQIDDSIKRILEFKLRDLKQ